MLPALKANISRSFIDVGAESRHTHLVSPGPGVHQSCFIKVLSAEVWGSLRPQLLSPLHERNRVVGWEIMIEGTPLAASLLPYILQPSNFSPPPPLLLQQD